MADDNNRLNDGPLGDDTLGLGASDAPQPGTTSDLPEDDDLFDEDDLDADDAAVVDADLFDDGDDLVPLDQIDTDDDDDDVTGTEDDNPYQESDEALPDDDEERSIARDLRRD